MSGNRFQTLPHLLGRHECIKDYIIFFFIHHFRSPLKSITSNDSRSILAGKKHKDLEWDRVALQWRR